MTTDVTVPVVELDSGRRLSYAVVGDAGPWCVHHHGTGSSRLEGELFAGEAARSGFRLLTIDRPSYGHSTPDGDRTLADWPTDVVAVADHLGIGRFAVSGLSGGGPHALATAVLQPGRVTHAVVVNSGGPTDDEELLAEAAPADRRVWTLARDRPDVFRRVVSPLMSRPPGRLSRLLAAALLPAHDRRLLEDHRVETIMTRSGDEGRRQPGRRFDEALLIWGGDWGFDTYDVDIPVHVFSGRQDQGRAFARRLAERVADGTLHEFEGGHMGFLAADVMAELGAVMRGESPDGSAG